MLCEFPTLIDHKTIFFRWQAVTADRSSFLSANPRSGRRKYRSRKPMLQDIKHARSIWEGRLMPSQHWVSCPLLLLRPRTKASGRPSGPH